MAACLVGICGIAAYGQIYQAGSAPRNIYGTKENNTNGEIHSVEIYGAAAASVHAMADDENAAVSFLQQGFAAGVRVRVWHNLEVGLEAQHLPRTVARETDWLRIDSRACYFTARWNLTPDISPPLYAQAGYGRVQTRFNLELSDGKELVFSSSAFFIGLGTAWPLGGGISAGLSLRAQYTARTDFGYLLHYRSHWSAQALALVSYGF